MGKGSTTHQLQKFEALGYSPLHQLSSSLGVERSGRGEQGPPARLVCRRGNNTPTSSSPGNKAAKHSWIYVYIYETGVGDVRYTREQSRRKCNIEAEPRELADQHVRHGSLEQRGAESFLLTKRDNERRERRKSTSQRRSREDNAENSGDHLI